MNVLQLIRFCLPLALVIGTTSLSFAQKSDSVSRLQDGIDAYQSAIDSTNRNERVQLFSRAEMVFARVASEKGFSTGRSSLAEANVSPDLFLNWGNAALGAEHLGAAILAYRRALTIEPQDDRAKTNLMHARSLLPDWIPTPEDQISYGSFFDGARQMKKSQWRGLAAIVFLASLVTLAIYVRTSRGTLRNIAIVLAAFWIVALGVGWLPVASDTSIVGVVTADEAMVRSADSMNAPLRFPKPLVGGSEVNVIDRRDRWVRVGLFDGREGWLRMSAIEQVEP